MYTYTFPCILDTTTKFIQLLNRMVFAQLNVYFIHYHISHCFLILAQVKLFSQHAELRKIDATRLGRLVVLHFNYYTHDAAGQNMVTSSTWHLCKWVLRMMEKELSSVKVVNFNIESLLSGDKKAAYVNLMRTRGLHVQAEGWIPNAILKSVLKVCFI